MRDETCLFFKFGYCKREDRCSKIHLEEECLEEVCNSRDCNKMHPRPCKFFNKIGFCKYDTKCMFKHKLPKNEEKQNERIEALEKTTKMLLKLVEEQSATIKTLISKSEEVTKLNDRVNVLDQKNKEKEKARQLIDYQKNEVQILQDSIERLEKENKEKTETISQLERDVFELKEMVQVDTVPETNRICKEKGWSWVEQTLSTLDEMEEEIRSCRKDAKNLRSKYESFCHTLRDNLKDYGKLNITHHYTQEIEKLCRFLETPKQKSDKEDCLKIIKERKENVRMMSEIVTEQDWDMACTKMSNFLLNTMSM